MIKKKLKKFSPAFLQRRYQCGFFKDDIMRKTDIPNLNHSVIPNLFRDPCEWMLNQVQHDKQKEPFFLARDGFFYALKQKKQGQNLAFMEMRGLEPLTSCMPCKRSSQMSYTPELTKI